MSLPQSHCRSTAPSSEGAEDKTEIYVEGCLPLTRVAEGGGAGVNERPVDVQSRTVTEPQRDVRFGTCAELGGREKVKLLTVDLYTEKSVFSATKYNHI